MLKLKSSLLALNTPPPTHTPRINWNILNAKASSYLLALGITGLNINWKILNSKTSFVLVATWLASNSNQFLPKITISR